MKKQKGIKFSLQNKFLILFICISLAPIAFFTFYTSNLTLDAMKKNTEQASLTQLKTIDGIVFEKSKNIQRFMDTVAMNDVVQQILQADNMDYAAFEGQIKKCAFDIEDVLGAVFVTPSGNMYTYNIDSVSVDPLRLQIIYGHINEKPGMLTWFGKKYAEDERVGMDNDTVLVGSTCNDLDERGGYKQTAKVYIYVRTNIFREALKDVDEGTAIAVLDSSGTLLSSNRQDGYLKILDDNLSVLEEAFKKESGVFSVEAEQSAEISVIHYSSDLTGFKYVKLYDSYLFYKDINGVKLYGILLLAALFLVMLAVYAVITKKITKPISRLANEMQNFREDNLNNTIDVRGGDEVATIAGSYNRMLRKISQVIEEVKAKEQQKKDAEFLALSYQINPHFLYNTLGAIRMMAMNRGEEDISGALLALNRILKTIFSNTSKCITLKKELELLESFIYLMGLRYKNKIRFSVELPEEAGGFIIPAMLLQPLVENAVLHGLAPKSKTPNFTFKIFVSVAMENNDVVIEVWDNGAGMTQEQIDCALNSRKGGVGLKNVDDRVKLMYGSRYGISIASEPGLYTSVFVRLPEQ